MGVIFSVPRGLFIICNEILSELIHKFNRDRLIILQ
jgi:hypothetical protein